MKADYTLARQAGAPASVFKTADDLAKAIMALSEGREFILIDGHACDGGERSSPIVVVRSYDAALGLAGELLGHATVKPRAALGSYGGRQTLSEAMRRADPALETHEISRWLRKPLDA